MTINVTIDGTQHTVSDDYGALVLVIQELIKELKARRLKNGR